MTNAAANSAPSATILPLLVLKKLMKSRGFISAFGWTDGMDARNIGDSDDGRRRGKARHQNGKSIFQGQFVAPAVRRAGDGEINNTLAFGRHSAVRVADGLRVETITRSQREAVWLINQGRVNLVGDGE